MRVAVDDVRVVAAGRLRRQLTEDEIDSLGHVDVLVIPVGGGDALGAIEAAKLVNAVEPSIVVPARFGAGDGGEFDPVGKFAQEMGLADGAWEPQPRLVLTGSSGRERRDSGRLPRGETRLKVAFEHQCVLSPRG